MAACLTAFFHTERMKKSTVTSLLIFLGVSFGTFVVSSCAPTFQSAQNSVADKVDQTLGCQNFEESLWQSFYESVEVDGQPPTADSVRAAMKLGFKSSDRMSKVSVASQDQISKLTSEIAGLVLLRTEIPGNVGHGKLSLLDDEQRKGLWLERIAQLEIGDRTTTEKSEDVDRVRASIEALKALAAKEGLLGVNCESTLVPPPTAAGPPDAPITADATLFSHWKAIYPAPVYGGLKTFAMLYQSCEAATRAPLGDEYNGVRGISVTGKHSSGTGNVRVISNLKSLLSDHPYVGSSVYKRPLPTCFDVQAKPAIYDYGGKPFTSTSNEKVFDMFKNGGSGSKELGIDCSALIYSAFATVGLKFKKETSLKASLVNGISSTMLTEPQKNGLTCLDHASFTQTKNLVPGDIVSIRGHVVLVADVGPDPLGISSINAAGNCKPSAMSISRFNFTILQSSPSKGAIGMNRMRARDYLSDSSTMGQGMIDHAVNACKAKFQVKPIVSKSTRASVVRHLGTAGCTDTQPIAFSQEACLSSCPPQTLDSI